MEWVFTLDALKDLTYSERAMVLDRLGSGGGVGEGEGGSTAVDARLVLRSGLDGWSRDRLLGLRLLFEWAERRRVFAGRVDESGGAKGGQSRVIEQGENDGKGNKDQGKGVTAATGGGGGGRKGKKKVSMSVDQPGTGVGQDGGGGTGREKVVVPEHERELDAVEKGEVWWLGDSAIEELKGRTWLAARAN